MKITHSKIGPDRYEILADRKKVAVVEKKVNREDHTDKRGRNRPRNVTKFVIVMEVDSTRLAKHPTGQEPTMRAVKDWIRDHTQDD